MLDLYPLIAAVPKRLLIDLAIYFGLFVIVAMALNFQYGNAGVPNMGCAVSASIGGYTVSAIITRITFWIVKHAGMKIYPYSSDYDWVYNNHLNTIAANNYLQQHALIGVALFFFSIALALILGWITGYIISLPAIRLKGTYLIITLIASADAAQIIGRNVVWISGGTLGMYIPNMFAWYNGDRSILTAMITLTIGIICYFIFRTMLNSPYGRLIRAMRENEITVNSVGKNVTKIRKEVLMFASAITAILGVLLTYYYSFCIESNFIRSTWTYWPWLMLMVGGPGNNAGTYLGAVLIILMRRLLTIYKWEIERFIWYPAPFLEQQLLGLLLLLVMMFKPNGLIPEKLLRIRGIPYRRLIMETKKVDLETIQRKTPNKISSKLRKILKSNLLGRNK